MNNSIYGKRGLSVIEILLSLSILLIIASWILRVIYAHELKGWEDEIYRLIGIDPDFARFAIGAMAIVAMTIIAIRKRRARRRKDILIK
jgi:prepilin-type N-terminal cleavage/methylation domain-containing protein